MVFVLVAVAAVALAAVMQRQLVRTRRRAERLVREARTIRSATEHLEGWHTPEDLLASACRLAAEVACPGAVGSRHVGYVELHGDEGRVVHGADAPGARFALADHPHLLHLYRRASAVTGSYDDPGFSPSVRALYEGLHWGLWVPVAPNGRLHGALCVSSRDAQLDADAVGRCRVLARVLELALGNATLLASERRSAVTDHLTGLHNRRGLEEAVADGGPMAVLAMDLDGLKVVNDTQGHAAGDRLLRAAAAALTSVTRRSDVVARVGGDEFVAVVFDARCEAGTAVAYRLLQVAAPLGVRLSVGVAECDQGSEFADALRRADDAMYRAKASGGMRVVLGEDAGLTDFFAGSTPPGCDLSSSGR